MTRLFWLPSALGISLCALAISGCGFTPGDGAVNQITLAVYRPLCIDVLDASTASGAPVQAYACGKGKRSQEWQIIPLDLNKKQNDGRVIIVNANSKMCMSVLDTPVTAPGQFVVQETCSPNRDQQDQIWTIVKAPGQAGYRFVSAASGQCLDLPFGAIASIVHLQQYYCTAGDPAQGWTLQEVVPGNTP